MKCKVSRGDLVWAKLDPTVGSEIQKCRPCVVVSADVRNGDDGNPMVVVVPITKAPVLRSPRWDEVVIEPGASGLRERSITATNQVRAIDRQRIVSVVGQVPADVLTNIDRLLQQLLALS